MYDSTDDTLAHIERVRQLLTEVTNNFALRGANHDRSKLESPEKEGFDRETPLLKELTYGSDEYKEALGRLGVSLQHHYRHNNHHPEHESMTEEWRSISRFPSYEVSNLGQVRGVQREVVRSKQGNFSKDVNLIKGHLTPRGYVRLQLSEQGKISNRLVHRLVADAFLDPPEEGQIQVNHKSGDKQNNRMWNLEWATPSQNLQHAYDEGLRNSNAKYVVSCEELNLETIGCYKMAAQLRALGHEKADPAGVYAAATQDNRKHCGLSFTAEPIMKPSEYSGINGMSLFDVLEMLVDWKAASERHDNGSIVKSLEINAKRFGIDEQLLAILSNTVLEFGCWVE